MEDKSIEELWVSLNLSKPKEKKIDPGKLFAQAMQFKLAKTYEELTPG